MVPCERDDFKAALVECDHNIFIAFVSRQLTNTERDDAVIHELFHACDIIAPGPTSSLNLPPSMDSQPNTCAPFTQANAIVPFAQAQKNLDKADKELVARWIAKEMPLSNGEGVFLDAGSQCSILWDAIREELRKHSYAHLAVRTNSFLVLDKWVEDNNVQFQGNTVETVGDVFDVAHCAFYGPAAKARLMEPTFRATVYMGTSGVEFTDSSILFGYHQGSLEGDFKRWLFQCPARSRVILATPRKIGNAGGRIFDLLTLDNLDTSAPIYFVTTNPPPSSPAATAFEMAQSKLRQDRMQAALRERGLSFTWITVDRDSDQSPKARDTFRVPDTQCQDR